MRKSPKMIYKSQNNEGNYFYLSCPDAAYSNKKQNNLSFSLSVQKESKHAKTKLTLTNKLCASLSHLKQESGPDLANDRINP